jgi:hypothetical protein
MNLGIVNRALLDVGQTALTEQDVLDNTTAFQACKQYYIDTFLEALSEVEWTGGRKRAKLARTGRPVLKDSRYRFAYDMPFDCAKPVELQNNEFFTVEGRIIYSDAPDAELLYVSNGRVLPPAGAISCGRPGEAADMEYLTAGPPGTEPDETVRAGGPGDFSEFGPPGAAGGGTRGEPVPLPGDPEPGNGDFPGYRQLEYEPKFYEYIERMLAAKLSMKLTDQPGLHVQLLQEAMLIKREAVSATKSRRSAKLEPKRWWAEEVQGSC